jgi:hypothetical protein
VRRYSQLWQALQLTVQVTRWTREQEYWLISASMEDVTNRWLAHNIPGPNRRSGHAIAGHFSEMRRHGDIPPSWRDRHPDDQDGWETEEDAEAIVWHVTGRQYIDGRPFVAHDRPGSCVAERADYLAEDVELVETVKTIVQRMEGVIGPTDNSEPLQVAVIEARREEELDGGRICRAVRESLRNRSNSEGSERDEEEEERQGGG